MTSPLLSGFLTGRVCAAALGGLLVLASMPSRTRAQTPGQATAQASAREAGQAVRAPATVRPAVDPLDAWLVTRYRGVNLLMDSAAATASLAASGPLPRVETARSGRENDTLLAVHFSAREDAAIMPIPSRARLVGANGTMATVMGRVLQRRLFRAPRVPGADPGVEEQWRYGWAYLVVVPHGDNWPVGRYRSWLLQPVPSLPL